jgi:L-threonylcarbamoyladenylate synthase
MTMSDINTEVHNAFEIIKNGGIILFPSDTVWGIGCDATNEEAIAKINQLTHKNLTTDAIVLMNSDRMMYMVFKEVPEVAWQILDLSEKPTTLILDNPRNVANSIISEEKSLGFRLVKEPFCYKLLERMKKPLVVTSANVSGMFFPKSFKEISPEIIKGVDYVVNLHEERILMDLHSVIKIKSNSEFKIIKK